MSFLLAFFSEYNANHGSINFLLHQVSSESRYLFVNYIPDGAGVIEIYKFALSCTVIQVFVSVVSRISYHFVAHMIEWVEMGLNCHIKHKNLSYLSV